MKAKQLALSVTHDKGVLDWQYTYIFVYIYSEPILSPNLWNTPSWSSPFG